MTLKPSGAVILHDHPEIAAEEALVALGDAQPYCLEILALLRRYRPYESTPYGPRELSNISNPTLRSRVDAAGEIRQQRLRCRRSCHRQDPCRVRFAQRWDWTLEESAHAAVERLQSRRRHQGRVPLHLWPVVPFEPRAPRIVLRESGTPNAHHTIIISTSWARVLARGLAIVDDSFVLAILEDTSPPVVLAARERTAGRLTAEPARVTPDGRLAWLQDAQPPTSPPTEPPTGGAFELPPGPAS